MGAANGRSHQSRFGKVLQRCISFVGRICAKEKVDDRQEKTSCAVWAPPLAIVGISRVLWMQTFFKGYFEFYSN